MKDMREITIEFLKENEDLFLDIADDRPLADFRTTDINYHPPRVHRLSIDCFGMRINYHKIFPCRPENALLHPHPWPSGMIVFSEGEYEMGIGHSPGDDASSVGIDCRLSLSGKFYYTMNDRDGWHYVAPRTMPAYTVMVTGPKWDRWSPGPEGKLLPLQADYAMEVLNFFKNKIRK